MGWLVCLVGGRARGGRGEGGEGGKGNVWVCEKGGGKD
jgi:hypothetical protein